MNVYSVDIYIYICIYSPLFVNLLSLSFPFLSLDGAARQVRGVLDTNAKLQQELVQLSRDLTQAEASLDATKRTAKEELKQHSERTLTAESQLDASRINTEEWKATAERSRSQVKTLEETKNAVVVRLQQLTNRCETLQDE